MLFSALSSYGTLPPLPCFFSVIPLKLASLSANSSSSCFFAFRLDDEPLFLFLCDPPLPDLPCFELPGLSKDFVLVPLRPSLLLT